MHADVMALVSVSALCLLIGAHVTCQHLLLSLFMDVCTLLHITQSFVVHLSQTVLQTDYFT